MYTRQTFTKTEKLCSKMLTDKLFKKGKSFFIYPFKVIYRVVDDNDKFTGSYPAKILVSVSKRNFKRAVDRNHIKRLVRESYRKNKGLLYETLDRKEVKITIGIIFTGKQSPTYAEIEKKIIQVIHRLILDFKKHEKKSSQLLELNENK
jgi:ribonuclease P protein component